MKKIFTAIALISLSTHISAQLTRGEIYDFQPGDVFHVMHNLQYVTSPGPVYYVLDSVTNRSDAGGEITYIFKRTTITGSPFTGTVVTEENVTQVVDNLAAPGDQYMSSCIDPLQSIYTDECNTDWERVDAQYDTSCFEPPIGYSMLGKGLGGPYYRLLEYSNGPMITETKLLYYKTAVAGECGSPYYLGMDDKEKISFEVYPNPASDFIQIRTADKDLTYSISDIRGLVLQSGIVPSDQIPLNFPVGTYLLTLKSEIRSTTKMLVVQ